MAAAALRVVVVKATGAPIRPAFLRSVLRSAAASSPLAEEVARRAGEGEAELTIRITGDRELRRLNRDFLGEDHTTDVLSFPSGAASGGYLGDLALSWPAVVRQADQFGHSVELEAALLCVHGLLHLLGWDHTTPRETRAMTALTLRALGRSGLKPAPSRL